MLRRAPAGVPSSGVDLFSDSAIREPYGHYGELRALGPVVWLSKLGMYAVARHAECRDVLGRDGVFISGKGVGLNRMSQFAGRGTTLNSDGDQHRARRQLVAHRLTPRALRPMAEDIARLAEEVVEAAVRTGDVDGAEALANALPLRIVPDFVGWPEGGRRHLMAWGSGIFDFLGAPNRRMVQALPATVGMLRFSQQVVKDGTLIPGSLGDEVVRAAAAGTIKKSECPGLMVDYLGPSLDTTASAISNALWLFATNPEQWELLRREPERVAAAVIEVLRIESPLRAFSRLVATDATISEVAIPRGSRVLVLYASANRDERVFDEPARFDITRDAGSQLAFGYGAHGCAGQGLARLETEAMLRSLISRVERIELTGTPVIAENNLIRRFGHLPLRLVPLTAAA